MAINDGIFADGGGGGGGSGGVVTGLSINGSDVLSLTQDAGTSPLTVDLSQLNDSDHGGLSGLLDDDHTQYFLLAGRAGGQTAFGGLVAADGLTLAANAAGNDGLITLDSEVRMDFNPTGTGLTHFMNVIPTYTGAAGLNGGFNYSPNITVTSAVSIIEAIRGLPTITQEAATAFSAFTLFQALPIVRTVNTSFNPMQALILNAGPTSEVAVAGTPPANPSMQGMNFAPQTRATVVGAVSTVTTQTAVRMQPTFSTVGFSTANLGTLRGLHCSNPTVALFQPQAGVETLTAFVGVDIDAIPFGGNVTKRALRSALVNQTNTLMIENTGGADSDFGAGDIRFDDLAGIQLGTGQDLLISWGNAAEYFWQWNASNDQLRWSNPSSNRYIFQTENGNADGELNMGFEKFSFGQTGVVGNQVGVFVANARATGVAGGWADFLLTQAGNLTIDHTMSDVSAWVINPISLTSGAGSITGFVAGLQVGQTNSGLGGADTMALRVNGRSHKRGVDELPPLSPASLTADVNDYAPATGSAMRQVWRLTTDDLGARNVTGIAIQQGNDTQWITNVGTVDNIVLQHQNGGSVAANRIISPTGADLTLGPDESALLWYDDTTTRWRILYHTGA